jgi:hypothetical protein
VIARKNWLSKTLFTAAVFAVALAPSAGAAPKVVVIKQMVQITQDASAEAMVVTSKYILTYANFVGQSADIKIRAIDFTGAQIWEKTIDSGWDEVVTAITVDAQGSIWLAGNSAAAPSAETSTATTGALNPDAINSESTTALRPDMKNIALWQLSSTGDLLAQVNSTTLQPALVDAISANATGTSVLLARDSGQSLVSVKAGSFSKELTLGTAKSKFKTALRGSDGSTYLFGSSSETLGGKKLAGKVDGILLKVSQTGTIASVVRSSAPKAFRDWQSATTSLFLTGVVKSGNTIETAVTKFTSTFAPTWTARFASTGLSLATPAANGSVFAIFEPTSLIKGVSGWKVTKGQSAALLFDSKGAISGAFTSPLLNSPISTGYSGDGGLIVLTSTGIILRTPAR